MERRRHLRCPACGKLSQPSNFRGNPHTRRAHEVGARTQTFTGLGRGRGFAWSGAEPLTAGERDLLLAALRAAYRRLRG